MNFKVLATVLLLTSLTSAYAGNNVTCRMASIKNTVISATLPLSAVNGAGVESSGNGLDIGRENHSFMMELAREGAFYRVDVIFYENNNAQDEVGSLSCKFKKSSANSVICQEPVRSESGKLIAQFTCINN